MSFKTDWSFLDKITMGAIGTKKVIQILNSEGHNIIELERYSTSNKIWKTKIKRLRMPDLICLHCGKKIESRAKSQLKIIMSDAENNDNRRWFSGLRDNDMVAFINCYKDELNKWVPKDTVNIFSVGDMKLAKQTKLSGRKGASEGSEQDRRWDSYTPSFNFTVTEMVKESNGIRIKFKNDSGQKRSKLIKNDHYIYVKKGDTFEENSKIVSGVIPINHTCCCSKGQYDFFSDLTSEIPETKYAAVKALGYLPKTQKTIVELKKIGTDRSTDNRIRLEAYASLLRLGEDYWKSIHDFVFALDDSAIKMEYVLIMGELNGIQSCKTSSELLNIIKEPSKNAELKAAAIWSLPSVAGVLRQVINCCFSSDETIRNHAIAKIEKNFLPELTNPILEVIGSDDFKNAICVHILTNSANVDCSTIVRYYVAESDVNIRRWILFVIGLSGSQKYITLIQEIDPNAKHTIAKIEIMWRCFAKAISEDQANNIRFIKKQN
jgi:hypothetical protein